MGYGTAGTYAVGEGRGVVTLDPPLRTEVLDVQKSYRKPGTMTDFVLNRVLVSTCMVDDFMNRQEDGTVPRVPETIVHYAGIVPRKGKGRGERVMCFASDGGLYRLFDAPFSIRHRDSPTEDTSKLQEEVLCEVFTFIGKNNYARREDCENSAVS